jgi:hypothetical protein
MRCVALLLTVFITVAGHGHAQSVAASHSEAGAVADGLRLRLASAARDSTPSGAGPFLVTLENVGNADFVVNLGSMLANGKVMWPSAIRLLLTTTGGSTRELRFSDRRYPAIAGRVDDFLVPLRSGSSYTVLLKLDDYWSPSTREFVLSLDQGTYELSARLDGELAQDVNLDMQGVALLNFWKGSARSNVLEFAVGR